MARKNYPDELKRDADGFNRDTDDAMLTAIAAGLGVSDATFALETRHETSTAAE